MVEVLEGGAPATVGPVVEAIQLVVEVIKLVVEAIATVVEAIKLVVEAGERAAPGDRVVEKWG